MFTHLPKPQDDFTECCKSVRGARRPAHINLLLVKLGRSSKSRQWPTVFQQGGSHLTH